VTADPPPAREVFLVGAHGPQRTVEYAIAAEQAGFEGVWLAEHHFGAACEPEREPCISYGQTPSATALAAHILGRTRRIAVGTAACVLSARHPVALGEEAVLIDAVAPGRFRLGVARGGPWLELEVFGTGLDRYRRGFAEALDLLLRWLSGASTVAADGEWFGFREVAVVPRPAGPLPVWVAATSPPTVDIAAARGLPLLLGVQDDAAAKAAMLDRYAQTATAHGHDPVAVPHASVHLAYLGDPAALRPRLAAWLATTREYVRLDGTPPQRDLDAYVDHLLRIHPVGRPAEVAGRLAEAAVAAGVRHLLLMVEAAGPETADQLAALGSVCPASSRRVDHGVSARHAGRHAEELHDRRG
jgi:alkanesulfonate monooxygenase SsuD/methylene tetrahydromethanopterin reductase-like flavin-dependent oxidoreductase (luciferase family)